MAALAAIWSLSLAPALADHYIKWVKQSPSGTAPSARAHHSAVYNPTDNSVIVFGGTPNRDVRVWKLSLTLNRALSWSELTPAGPPPPFGTDSHSAVYDPVDNSMVLFGGYDGTLYYNSLYKLTLGVTLRWGKLSPTSALPIATSNHASFMMPVADSQMMMTGGWVGSSSFWKITLSSPFNWARMPDISLGGRNGHTLLHHPVENALVMMGGYESGYKNTVWKLSLATGAWEEISVSGTPPSARAELTSAYFPYWMYDSNAAIWTNVGQMIVVGGLGENLTSFNDSWRLVLGMTLASPSWTQLSPQYDGAPPARYGHSMNIVDSARQIVAVIGGETALGATNEVWYMGPGTDFWAAAVSPTSMGWYWSGGWDATLQSIHNASHDSLTTSTADVGGWVELSLSANTAYTRHLKSFRPVGSDVEFTEATKYTFANSPSSLTAVGGNSTSLTLAWAGNGASAYHLVTTTDSAGAPTLPWQTTLKTWSSNYTSTLYTATGLTPENYYWYTVHNFNGDGTLNAVGMTLRARAGPKTPIGFSGAPASKTSVLWSWSDRAASETAYLLINSATGAAVLTLTANAFTATESGLTPNTGLGRVVAATDGISTSPSIAFTAYSLASVPTGLTVSATTATSVTLTWAGNGTRYSLERAPDAAGLPGTWTPVKTWSDGITLSSLVDLSVSSGTFLWYRVRAYNGTQFLTDPSDSLRAQTLLSGTPTAPTSSLQNTTAANLTFGWTAGTVVASGVGITGYHVQVGTTSGGSNLISLTLANVLVYNVTNTSNGLTYFARVRAFGDGGFMSDWSPSSLGVVVDSSPPGAPTLSSPTHSLASDTYANSTIIVTLTPPQDASGIAGYYYLFDQTGSTVPTSGTGTWSTAVAYTFSSVQDGAWYFHAIAKDNTGNVGTASAHLTLQVKTKLDPSVAATLKFSDGTEIQYGSGTVASATVVNVTTPAAASLPSMITDAYVKPTSIAREISLADGTTSLSKALTIVISYTDTEVAGLDESKLKLAYWDTTLSQWKLIGNSSASASTNKIVAIVDHFTLFRAVTQALPTEALEGVGNYPNPFIIGQESTRIRYSMKEDAAVEIRIFDLLGTLVWEKSMALGAEGGAAGTQEVTWDGRDKDGSSVGTGGYICVIKAGGKVAKIKIGVK